MKPLPLHTLFGKLIIIYGVTLLFFIAGSTAFRIISSSSTNVEISEDHLQHYSEYLIQEIGIPPDRHKLEKILLETGLKIHINGPQGSLFGELDDDDEEGFLNPEDNWLSWLLIRGEKESKVEITREGYQFTIYEFHSDYRISLISGMILSMFVLLGIFINYILVRALLQPLQKMYDVALKFGVNDWSPRVKPEGRDELAILGKEMDIMADRIVSHIESMQDLLYAVSHEFRSPLTRMNLMTEFMKDSKLKESMKEEILSLDKMVEGLLEQKRLTRQPGILELTPRSIQKLAEGFIKDCDLKNIFLNLEISGPDKIIHVDENRIRLALSNLVENCLKHAPGAPIHLQIKTSESSSGCEILIWDEGSGIPSSLLNKLGEPFLSADTSRTGNRTTGGFGLGLSIVKAIAQAHGASMIASNRTSGGFQVVLKFSGTKE